MEVSPARPRADTRLVDDDVRAVDEMTRATGAMQVQVPLPPPIADTVPATAMITSQQPWSPRYIDPEMGQLVVPLMQRFRLLIGDAAELVAQLAVLQRPGMAPPPPAATIQDAFASGGLVYFREVWTNVADLLDAALEGTLARDVKAVVDEAAKAAPRSPLGQMFSAMSESVGHEVAHATRDIYRAIARRAQDAPVLQEWMGPRGREMVARTKPCGSYPATVGTAVIHGTAMDISGGLHGGSGLWYPSPPSPT